jgi:hypothetical protein
MSFTALPNILNIMPNIMARASAIASARAVIIIDPQNNQGANQPQRVDKNFDAGQRFFG